MILWVELEFEWNWCKTSLNGIGLFIPLTHKLAWIWITRLSIWSMIVRLNRWSPSLLTFCLFFMNFQKDYSIDHSKLDWKKDCVLCTENWAFHFEASETRKLAVRLWRQFINWMSNENNVVQVDFDAFMSLERIVADECRRMGRRTDDRWIIHRYMCQTTIEIIFSTENSFGW